MAIVDRSLFFLQPFVRLGAGLVAGVFLAFSSFVFKIALALTNVIKLKI